MGQRRDDQREAAGQVVAGAAVEANAAAVLARDQAKAVVLDSCSHTASAASEWAVRTKARWSIYCCRIHVARNRR